MEKKQVFITGGSGFLGINLIRYLLKKDYEIISYDIVDFDYPERTRITAITGDIRDKKALTKAMAGCQLVVHAAAALPLYSEADIFSTDVDGTRNVLESALANNVDRVVYISSTAVYGVPDHHPLIEDDKLIGVGPYGQAKIDAEHLCEEYRAKGLPVAILRPKSFVGPERLGVFALLFDWARDGKNFPLIGNGKNRYQLLDVEDLCQAIYLCLTKDRAIIQDTFNIGAKEFTTMAGDYQAVLTEAGHDKKVVPLPAGPVIAALRVLEALHLSPLYKWVYETAGKDSFVSIEKAERILGYRPAHSNKEALIRNYRWYIDHLDTFKSASGVSHRVPWKQGILKLAKIFF